MKSFRREILLAGLWLLMAAPVMATDVTISALTWTNLPFNASNLGTDRSITVTATNGSPTVTSSAAFPANIVGIGGFKVAIGGTTYTVSSIASTSSLTLTTNFSGSTGSATMTLYKYVLLRAYANASFQPNGETYVIQPGTPGSGSFYKQVAASIINSGSGNVLYTPDLVLPATTNATINNQARYVLGWYRSDGSLIQFLVCGSVQQLAIPTTTPTTWGALCTYNSPGGVVPPNNEVYTKTQIDVRFPSCSSGQMLYYAATGNVQSCLTVGSNLSITGGTLNASGGGSSTQTRQAINVKQDYSCVGDGVTNDTTCIQNAITAALASTGKILYFPTGTYLTDPITQSINGLTIIGDGRGKSYIKARTANNPIVNITSANYAVNFVIDSIGFLGQGKASGSSGHCVSISDATGGTAQFEIRNSGFTDCGGKGLYIPYMFAGRFRNNLFDEIGDNHLEIQGGSATIVEGNDFKTLEANKIALWVYSGNPVITGNNGIEPDSGSGSIWGRFGRSSADGDGADSYVLGGSFIGNNVEDFKATGWQFRTGSGGSTYAGNTFISPSSGTVTALYFQFLSGTELGIWSGGTFTLQGTTAWTNSQPVHSRGYAPFYVSGTNTPANFYEWNAAETRTLPYVRPKLLAGTTKNGLQVSEAIFDAVYDSNLAGTLTGTTDPSGNASRVLLQNGSASRPVFGSSVDSTTGAYFGTNTIGFTVGGTSRATLTNSAFLPTVKATFSPTATVAGLNVGSVSGDPSAPANGDLWYDSTGNILRARINGATVSLGAGGGGSMSIGGTVTSGTAGSVLFVASGPVLAQDNTNFYFDDTNNRLSLGGIGGSPATPLHVLADSSNLGLRVKANAAAINVDLSSDGSVGFLGTTTTHPLELWTDSTTRIRIESGGLVGINDVTPGAQLDVTANGTGTVGAIINGASGATADLLKLQVNGTDIIRFVPVSGDVNTVLSDSALATTATDGFVYFPSMAGVPSGVPTGYTGTIPLVIDSTNSRLYGRIGGSWVNLSGSGSSGITIGTTTITSGTNTRVLYNNSGVVGEYSVTGTGNAVLSASPTLTGTVAAAALTLSGQLVSSLNGAASTPPATMTGTWFTGGTATTTKPQFLIEPTGATSTGWSTNGTGLGVNSASGFTGNLIDVQVNGSSRFLVSNSAVTVTPDMSVGKITASNFINAFGNIFVSSTSNIQFNADTFLRRAAVANLAFGATDAASPVAQTISVQNVVAGTSNTAGANWTFAGSRGTGTGTGGAIIWQIAPAGGSGTSQNVLSEAMRLSGDGGLRVGPSTASQTGSFTVLPNNAATNSVVDVARLGVNSTGTAASGFGGSLSFSLETSTTNDTQAGSLEWLWSDATHASRTSQVVFKTVYNAGTATEVWGLTGAQNYGAVENDKGSASGSVTVNWNQGNHQKITLTGNITTLTFSNVEAGAFYVLQLVQDATGSRNVAKPSNVIIPGGASGGNITGLTATANAVDELWCRSNGTTVTCFVVADVKN